MKKGQIYEGTVSHIEFPNKGIIRIEDEKAVVKNTLPGQRISFVVQKKRKGKVEGRCLEVLERSPLEIESPCPHFGVCGGCNYQTLTYEDQCRIKEEQVRKLLDQVYINRNIEPSFEWEGIRKSPEQFGYRNKMEFSFGDEYLSGPLALGMHKRGSFYDIANVDECQIVDEDYRLILREVLTFFRERNASFYHKMRHEGFLRHLLVRKAKKTGEILIALVTSTKDAVSLEGFADRLLSLQGEREFPKGNEMADRAKTDIPEEKEEAEKRILSGKIVGILHTRNDSLADVVQSDETEILYGQDYFYEELLGLRFRISQFSFFQTNSLGAEVLYQVAREYVGTLSDGEAPDKTVYDLYSGTGTIAQLLAPVAKEVIGVEIVEEAVEAAKKNAELNGLHNCKFIAGDVLKVLDTIEQKPDMIVLDPPRDGIHPKALQKIIDYGVDRIVYISCKPTSLARDLEAFLDRGYHMEKGCCVDMFPGTANVETVVQLSKGDIDRVSLERKSVVKASDTGMISGYSKGNKASETTNIKIDFSLENLDLSELRGKATYEQIKDYVREQKGFRVSTLYISQVKRKCGLEVGESYNKPKSEDARQPQCTPEKEEAIMQALRHFGMI